MQDQEGIDVGARGGERELLTAVVTHFGALQDDGCSIGPLAGPIEGFLRCTDAASLRGVLFVSAKRLLALNGNDGMTRETGGVASGLDDSANRKHS